jgi:hypothetical protein
MLRALRPQAVRQGEPAVEVFEVGCARERRHLVDDGIRLRSGHRLPDPDRIEAVDDDRLGAELADGFDGRFAGRRPGHGVAASDQHRHEPPPDGAIRACNKYPHGWASFSSTPKTR